MRVRKRPVEVEARRFTGEMDDGLERWLGVHFNSWIPSKRQLEIGTLEGMMIASAGDYVIRGVAGEFYPCKPEIFERTYEVIHE